MHLHVYMHLMQMHKNTSEAAERCQLHNHFVDNSTSPRVGRLEAFGQRWVVVDEDVWGARRLQHLPTPATSSSGPWKVGRGVREALVTVLTLPHTSCTVIWRGKGLIKWSSIREGIAKRMMMIIMVCFGNSYRRAIVLPWNACSRLKPTHTLHFFAIFPVFFVCVWIFFNR